MHPAIKLITAWAALLGPIGLPLPVAAADDDTVFDASGYEKKAFWKY